MPNRTPALWRDRPTLQKLYAYNTRTKTIDTCHVVTRSTTFISYWYYDAEGSYIESRIGKRLRNSRMFDTPAEARANGRALGATSKTPMTRPPQKA